MTSIPLKISGFVDYSEKENRLFTHWKRCIENAFSLYGFMGFQPRPVESIAALQTKGGISHQIYTLGRLHDGTMTDLALPFDHTVPLAVYVAAHRHELCYPFKRFDISHCFRGERPQAGRARGFIQADIDIVDEQISALGEVECLNALTFALESLGIPPFTIYMNHIEIPKAIISQMGFSQEELPHALRILDKMDKIGEESVRQELLELSASSDLSLLSLFSFKGRVEDFQQQLPPSLQTLPGFSALQEILSLIENPSYFSFSPGMVRGLDYYTGLVLETFFCDYSSFGSIASGGRYNNLIGSLVPSDKKMQLEGFGLSIGLTRLFDILKKQNQLPKMAPSPAQLLVGFRESKDQVQALHIAGILRKQGISTDFPLGKSNLGKQLAYADKKEIPFALIFMGETFVVKNLREGTQSEDLSSLEEAISLLLKWI